MRKLPPLTALPAFEATARLGSVNSAAQELGRTHGAVSKQIQNLSEALGVRLFEKEGTGLRLSAAGETLLPGVTEALNAIEAAAGQARALAAQRLLVGVSSSFASRWLMPRFPRFAARHPDIHVEFEMSGRVVQELDTVDFILTWDRLRLDRSSFPYESLGDVAFGLVAAPGYPVTVGEGTVHVPTHLVQDTFPASWDAWSKLSGMLVTSDRSMGFPQTSLSIEAAAAGLGAVLMEKRLVEEELDDKRLVAPVGFVSIKDGFGLYYGARRAANPLAEPFIEWLREEAA